MSARERTDDANQPEQHAGQAVPAGPADRADRADRADDVEPCPPSALVAGSAQEDSSIRLSCFMDSSRCKALAGEGRKSPLAR